MNVKREVAAAIDENPFQLEPAHGWQRAPRFRLGLPAQIQAIWWNPLSISSGYLLDVSWKGCKLQWNFAGPPKLQVGQVVKVSCYCPAMGDEPAVRFNFKVLLRWFDPVSKRAGGLFVVPTRAKQEELTRLIECAARLL